MWFIKTLLLLLGVLEVFCGCDFNMTLFHYTGLDNYVFSGNELSDEMSLNRLDCIVACGLNTYCRQASVYPSTNRCKLYSKPSWSLDDATTEGGWITYVADCSLNVSMVMSPLCRDGTSFLYPGVQQECLANGRWNRLGVRDCVHSFEHDAVADTHTVHFHSQMHAGMTLTVLAQFDGVANAEFRLCYNGDIRSLVIGPRFFCTCTVFNTYGTDWEAEEYIRDEFPFVANQQFNLTIQITDTTFEIFVDEAHFKSFTQRKALHPTTRLMMEFVDAVNEVIIST
ncbi:uncharacterized protein LOC124137848 [Haliotis rufescens]|uniref:uncharacterized protein LOC124137848 n=1 Tax=Haliotis rufescens TaxID=6454 RepID=UPI00201F496E|nr:uncharacterized protein LOC124137848 [Haliotis rufescens]